MSANLLDLLADGTHDGTLFQFGPDDSATVTASTIWRRSDEVADWLSARTEEGEAVAAVLVASPDCLATLVGAWRAGLAVASLPMPARGMGLDEYQAQVEAMCELVGARFLLVPGEYLPVIPPMPLPVEPFEGCAGAPPGRRSSVGELVQFTSGSTSRPKGVRLSLEAVAANVLALLDMLRPQPEDAVVSWLPLSHDMGLVGTCLTAWAAGGPTWASRGRICLMKPESFLANPSVWLDTCSRLGATFTAAPNFGLELGARMMKRGSGLDLRRLRALVTGAELVRPSTLREFGEAGARFGFDETAFCPAYGLAEATLAVTVVRLPEHWRSVTVEPGVLADGVWREAAEGRELVSCGRPVEGTEVRTDGTEQVGEIQLRGPALLTSYVGAGTTRRDADGWLSSGDLGHVDGRGELFVTGRLDDLIVVAGRNLYAWELESAVADHAALRPGNCVAVPNDEGRYVIVAEPQAEDGGDALVAAAGEIRSTLAERYLAPAGVYFVPKGSLPKTPSGKIRRHRVASDLSAGQLETVRAVVFQGR